MDDIFTLSLSSDSEPDEPNSISQEQTSATRASKLRQTELQFRQQKSSWKPVCADIQARRRQQYSSATAIVTKDDVLELKAASEERYYMRDYAKSLELAVRALAVGGEMVHPVERKELLSLKEKCSRRIASLNTV